MAAATRKPSARRLSSGRRIVVVVLSPVDELVSVSNCRVLTSIAVLTLPVGTGALNGPPAGVGPMNQTP